MKTKLQILVFLCLLTVVVSRQIATTHPVTVHSSTEGEGSCPAESVRASVRVNISRDVSNLLQEIAEPAACEGGGWKRVVYLNMTDTSTECPNGWQLTRFSRRSCGLVSTAHSTCDSAVFSTAGNSYSVVCGRVIGYQYGGTTAFHIHQDNQNVPIDDFYVEGVSVTHGPAGSRHHIWTFASGLSEDTTQFPEKAYYCPCDNPTTASDIPSYVGSDYFCESGSPIWPDSYRFYPDDPLWDGSGCTQTSNCCTFNSPPWFRKELPSTTTDDLEFRICDREFSDETVIELIEIYIQ